MKKKGCMILLESFWFMLFIRKLWINNWSILRKLILNMLRELKKFLKNIKK